jgi:hypothetical protein
MKGEDPALAGPCLLFLSTFNSSELSETKMPVLADLFLACRWLISSCLWIFGRWFLGVKGLTHEFAGFLGYGLVSGGSPNEKQRQYSIAPSSDYAPAFGTEVATSRCVWERPKAEALGYLEATPERALRRWHPDLDVGHPPIRPEKEITSINTFESPRTHEHQNTCQESLDFAVRQNIAACLSRRIT